MTQPHLRVLTERQTPLPPSLASRASAWQRAGKEAADALRTMLAVPVTAEAPRLGLTDTQRCTDAPAGVLCPLKAGRGHVRVPAADALRLSMLLLRSEETFGEAVLLDALLIRSVASAVTRPVASAFGTSLEAAPDAPSLDWPLAERAVPILRVSLPFVIGEAETDAEAGPKGPASASVVIDLLLAAPHAPFAAPEATPAPSPALRRAALRAPAAVEAVLDSWSVSPRAAAALSVGNVLPLPGASVEALDLSVRTVAGTHRLGQGELGRAGGRQAVRVTSVG